VIEPLIPANGFVVVEPDKNAAGRGSKPVKVIEYP
jgi:hypothetical protein